MVIASLMGGVPRENDIPLVTEEFYYGFKVVSSTPLNRWTTI
jgi:hypothetical protein